MTKLEADLLHRALELCDGWNGRMQIETMGGVKGPIKSRYGKDESWTCGVDGVTFRLFPHGLAPNARHFHRLYVRCPVCGKEVPAGRLHQHAVTHVPACRHHSGVYQRTSLWHRNWYVDDLGNFKPKPREFQREFPSLPAGF
jgi:hypothetical protein